MHRPVFELRIAALALLCGALAAPARAGVIVVDATGGGDQLTIEHGVQAAADGDVLLVRAGVYPPFLVDGKSVAIVADAGAVVTVAGTIHVRDVPAGKTVLLDRLNATGATTLVPDFGYGLIARNCAGRLRIQNCTLTGAKGFGLTYGGSACAPGGQSEGWSGARAENCADVAIALSQLLGGDGGNLFNLPCDGVPTTGTPGGDGLLAWNSAVSIYDTTAMGGKGSDAWFTGGQGGHGLELDASDLFASNLHATGADGGAGNDFFGGTTGGAGGNGLRVGAGSSARLLAGSFVGGVQGFSLFGGGGTPSPPTGGSGSALVLSGGSKGFGMPKVLREGQSTFMLFTGVPGETALLLMALGPDAVYAPALKGTLLLSGATLFPPAALGVLAGAGATGSLNVPVSIPLLPAGVLAAEVWLQAALANGSGQATLASASHLTLLDASL